MSLSFLDKVKKQDPLGKPLGSKLLKDYNKFHPYKGKLVPTGRDGLNLGSLPIISGATGFEGFSRSSSAKTSRSSSVSFQGEEYEMAEVVVGNGLTSFLPVRGINSPAIMAKYGLGRGATIEEGE